MNLHALYIETSLKKLNLDPNDINLVFFWKPYPKEKGTIDASCCCQWWRSRFKHEGVYFKTAEHAMMYGKAKLFNDQKAMKAILEEDKPHVAKSIGRQVENFDNEQWDDYSYDLVRDLNYQKFNQDPRLKRWLLGLPDNTLLVEASPYDRIWGIGLEDLGQPEISDYRNWVGLNKLGFAVTEVMQRLKKEVKGNGRR